MAGLRGTFLDGMNGDERDRDGASDGNVVASTALVVRELPADLVSKGRELSRRPASKATKRAYRADWRRFKAWCEQFGQCRLPTTEDVLVAYVTHLGQEGLAGASIARAYSAIRVAHDTAGCPLPVLRRVNNALTALRKLAPGTGPKKALLWADVCQAVDTLPSSREGDFERVVLLGELLAMRRSEFVALELEWLEFSKEGVRIKLPDSKTGERLVRAFRRDDHCFVAALEQWVKRTGVTTGRVFPNVHIDGRAVADIVKKAAVRLGFRPQDYAGHSLRRGFVTSAARQGADLDKIMRTTGHRSVNQVRSYVDDAGSFEHAVDLAPVHPTTGQKLTKKKRVDNPSLLRNGRRAGAIDLKWIRRQVERLLPTIGTERTLIALTMAGVRRGDGSKLDAGDLDPFLKNS